MHYFLFIGYHRLYVNITIHIYVYIPFDLFLFYVCPCFLLYESFCGVKTLVC